MSAGGASLDLFVDLVSRARSERKASLLTEAMPYARFLGITVDGVSGELIGKMAFSDMLIGNPVIPALHGGTIGGLLETTAILQTLWETETLFLPKIVTITIDYLRSGRPADTFARARITKHGRRVVNVHAEAWQEDPARPIARANAHFLVKPVET